MFIASHDRLFTAKFYVNRQSPQKQSSSVKPRVTSNNHTSNRNILYFRHEDFLWTSPPPSGPGYPPWILKQAGLESSG